MKNTSGKGSTRRSDGGYQDDRFIQDDSAERDDQIAGGREANLRDLQSLALLAGANGLIVGNYLTTPGRSTEDDLTMITDLGFHSEREPAGL